MGYVIFARKTKKGDLCYNVGKGVLCIRCYGNPKEDRICDLCEKVQPIYFDGCKNEWKRKLDLVKRKEEIREKCKYRVEEYKDRYTYYICKKKPWPHNNCNPCEECLE